jgi:spermidine synthase
MKRIKLKTFFKRCIYQSKSGIKIYQNPLYRWMTFSTKPIQTLINRYNPTKPQLTYYPPLALAAYTQPGNSCLLGLGGGGMVHMLSNTLNGYTFDVVELSEEVVSLSKQYFGLDTLQGFNLHQQDAVEFISQTKTSYQTIMIDLFDDNALPEQCTTDSFFLDCYNKLKADGVLSINIANGKQQWDVLMKLKPLFEQGLISIPIDGSANIVMIASKTKTVEPLLDMIYATQTIQSQSWDPDWGYIIEL